MNIDSAPISVVIPVRNRASIVSDTLRSVAAQSLLPSHLILIDNDSSDGTPDALHAFAASVGTPKMKITIASEKRIGASYARNAGLALADTEWVMFFDSDDTMLPRHIHNATKGILDNPTADIIGWDVVIKDVRGKRRIKSFAGNDTLSNCVLHGTMATQRYMARTELIRKAGCWNVNLQGWEDIELGTRLLMTNPNIAYLRTPPTVQVNAHHDSITGSNFSDNAGAWERTIDCIQSNLSPDDAWIADMKRAVLAGRYRREGNSQAADKLMSKHSRYIWKLIAAWTACGLPGAARIARVFMPKTHIG